MRGFDAWTLELTAWARTLPLHLPTLQPEATILHLESHFPCLYKAGYLRCPSWSGERVEAAMAQPSASFKAPQMFLMFLEQVWRPGVG